MILPKMLTRDEVAKLLDISTQTLRRWVEAGVFPQGTRFGRRTLRWRQEVVQAFLEKETSKT